VVEQGVFVGQGKGVVPLDNPNAPISMAHPYSCLIRCNPIAS
jgi:hypothetical protein